MFSLNKMKTIGSSLQEAKDSIVMSNPEQVMRFSVSKESAEPEFHNELANKLTNIQDMVESCIRGNVSREEYTDAQIAAAKMIAPFAMKRAGGNIINEALTSGLANANPSEYGVMDALTPVDAKVSTEAYDGQKTDNSFLYTILYTFACAKQDEFVETFFPTIAVDPTTSDLTVEVQLASLMKEFFRGTEGAPTRDKFAKIPLIKAIYNAEIFDTDKNRLVPVLRASNEDLFLKDHSFVSEYSLETVTTAPLKFGKSIDVLGVSQTDAQLARGQMDNTDALDRAIFVDKVWYSLTDDADTEMFSISTLEMANSQFNFNPVDHNKDLNLNFRNAIFAINTASTTTSKGTKSTILGKLPAGYTVAAKVTLRGDANTQEGTVTIDPGTEIGIHYIKDASGTTIPETDAQYKSIAAVIAKMKLEGYTLQAHSTNSNLRKRGQMLTVDTIKRSFPVPYRSGFLTIQPVKSETGTDNDANSAVLGHAQALGAKMSVCGVSRLLSDIDFLSQLTDGGTKKVQRAQFETGFRGIGQFLLDPVYVHRNIDLLTVVDSIDSASRDAAVRSSILQQIYAIAMQMYLDSDYGIVFDRGLVSTDADRPTLIIGTDPNIKRILVTEEFGEDTNLGKTFNLKIVSTFDSRMKNRVVIGFGVFDGNRNTTPNPMNYGFTAFSPTIVYDLVRDINNTTSRELSNAPRFAHYTNTPVVGDIEISNVEAVYGKLPVHMKNV